MIAITIVFVAYIFGIQGINQDTIRRDELTTLGHIGALEEHNNGVTLAETIDSLATYSAQHPPLYFVSLNVWGKYVSFDSFVMRLWSVFWGVMTIAVVYRLGRDMGGITVGVYAAVFLSTSVLFIFYAHELRQYAMLIFWTALTWLLYWRSSRRKTPPNFTQLAALTIATACAVYTHYSAIFLLVPMGLYHLIVVSKTRAWWMVSTAVILAGISFLPWIPTLLSGLQVTAGKVEGGHPELMYNNELMLIVAQFWGNGHWLLFAGLMGLGAISALLNRRNSRYLLYFTVAIAITILVVNGNFEFIKRLRYILVTLIPYVLLAGAGLALVSRWHIIPLAILAVWVGVGSDFQLDGDFAAQTGISGITRYIEYQDLVPIVRDNFSDDDVLLTVIVNAVSVSSSKQGKKDIEEYYLSPLGITYKNIHNNSARAYDLEELLQEIIPYPSIWIAYRGETPRTKHQEFLDAISATYRLCKQFNYATNSYVDQYVLNDYNDTTCNA